MSVLGLGRGHDYKYGRAVSQRRYQTIALVIVTLILVGASFYEVASSQAAFIEPGDPLSKPALIKPISVPAYAPAVNLTKLTSAGGMASGSDLGIAAGSSLTSLSQQQLDSRLKDISSLGATWIRFDFDWSQIQPDNANSYNWSTYDRLVSESNKYHLQILGILDYTPGWARISDCGDIQCPPNDDSQFATFAASVSQRYASQGVHDWEVWNEPNNPQFWKPGANPQAYVKLLQLAYNALHKQDPQAFVLSGGLSPQATTDNSYSPTDFLKAVYQAGGGSSLDAVADHPYSFPLTPANSGGGAWSEMVNGLRPVMVANGDSNKNIWITEFGAPTNGPGPKSTVSNPNLAAQPYVVDETLQAQELMAALKLTDSYSWAGPFFYYSYQDSGTDTSTNENFFGLVRADGSHKPAYAVFQQAAASSR